MRRPPHRDPFLASSPFEAQIGRPSRADSEPVRRCHLGLPMVVRVPPLLDDGTPFPTRHWLSCPLLRRRVAHLEARGAIGRLEARRRWDAAFRRALETAHERELYARQATLSEIDVTLSAATRARLLRGGIGGAREGIKCLHAHLAHFLAEGPPSPVGAWTWSRLGEPRCASPCVEAREPGGWYRAPGWRPLPSL